MMDADEYQRLALRTAPSGYISTEYLTMTALGLTGEAGEYADLIKKHVFHGHPLDAEKAAKEAGDVLWYIAVAAHALGFSLSDLMQANVRKLKQRYPEGFSVAASLGRQD